MPSRQLPPLHLETREARGDYSPCSNALNLNLTLTLTFASLRFFPSEHSDRSDQPPPPDHPPDSDTLSG
jgi:hypothetical protein